MRTNKIIILLLFCFSFNLYAESEKIGIKVKEVRSKIGLKFLFVERNDLPKVSLSISFKDAGYAYGSSEKQGLAWFTSQVIQEGSGKNDAKSFAKKLEDKGIRLHFNADLETFNAYLETLSENLEDSFSLLRDAIMYPTIDQEGFHRTLELAKVKFNYLKQDPYSVAIRELDTILFKKHPYANNQFGTPKTITNILRDDILKYIKGNFAKDNMVISIVGCVKEEEIARLLDKYLSQLPLKRSKTEKIPIKNDFGPAENKHIFMDIPQTVIVFAQNGVPLRDPNYYNASVLIKALGGMGLSSVLMKELRQSLGITYGVNAYMRNSKHGNVIKGSISTDKSTAKKSVSSMKEVLSRVKKEGINEQLFQDTKISMINDFIFSLFSNGNIVALLDHIQLNDFNSEYINDHLIRIKNVKLEGVNETAKSLLTDLLFVEVGQNT